MMNDLTAVDYQKTLDSRKIAEMVDKRHDNLTRDIKGYCAILISSDLRASNFFIESDYLDAYGRKQPRYLCTQMGCDMIANKLTGEKGILFTAAYVEKFHEMKEAPASAVLLCPEDVLIASLTLQKETRLEVERLGKQVRILEAKSETRQESYYTIAGFASLRGIKVDSVKAALLGKRATKLSLEYGYDIGKTHDPRYGHVNTYHVEILSKVLGEWDMTG